MLFVSPVFCFAEAAAEPDIVADRLIDGVGTRPGPIPWSSSMASASSRSATAQPFCGREVIELPGQTLMPGFINCHDIR